MTNSDGGIQKFDHQQLDENYPNAKHGTAEQLMKLEFRETKAQLGFANTTYEAPKQHSYHQAGKQPLRDANTKPEAAKQQPSDFSREPKTTQQQLRHPRLTDDPNYSPFYKKHVFANKGQARNYAQNMQKGKMFTAIIATQAEFENIFSEQNTQRLPKDCDMFITKELCDIIYFERNEYNQLKEEFNGPAYIKFAKDEAGKNPVHLEHYFKENDQALRDSIVLKNCPSRYTENISNASMVAFFKNELCVTIDVKDMEFEIFRDGKTIKIKFKHNTDRLEVLKAKSILFNTDIYIDECLTQYQEIMWLIVRNTFERRWVQKGDIFVKCCNERKRVKNLGDMWKIINEHDHPAEPDIHENRWTQDSPAGTVAHGVRHIQEMGRAGTGSSWNRRTYPIGIL